MVLGAQAYKGTVSGSHVSLTEVSDVPSGSAVVLKGNLFATVARTATSDMTGNDLNVSNGITADGSQYALAKVDSKVGFYKVTSGTAIPAGKAYIEYTTSSNGNEVNVFTFDFDDEDPTGIAEVENGKLKVESSIYNIAGQCLQKMQKGINIVNGKKVLY